MSSVGKLTAHVIHHPLVDKTLKEDRALGEAKEANIESGEWRDIHFGHYAFTLTWLHGSVDRDMKITSVMSAR